MNNNPNQIRRAAEVTEEFNSKQESKEYPVVPCFFTKVSNAETGEVVFAQHNSQSAVSTFTKTIDLTKNSITTTYVKMPRFFWFNN